MGITLAALPDDGTFTDPGRVPGVPVRNVTEPCFALADVTVRGWIAAREAAGRLVVIAPDGWLPQAAGQPLPGEDLLTFPLCERDQAVIVAARQAQYRAAAAALRGRTADLACAPAPGGQVRLFEGVTVGVLGSGRLLLNGGRMRWAGEGDGEPVNCETLEVADVASVSIWPLPGRGDDAGQARDA